jgi:hypothetical protein
LRSSAYPEGSPTERPSRSAAGGEPPAKPDRERLTLIRLFEELCALGYGGCRAQKPHPGSFSLVGWDGTLPPLCQ